MRVVRDSLRELFRSPRFTVAAIAVLAFGIGFNVAVLAAVRAMLLAPLPYKDSDQLVRIWEANPSQGISRSRVSRGNYVDWQREGRVATSRFASRSGPSRRRCCAPC